MSRYIEVRQFQWLLVTAVVESSRFLTMESTEFCELLSCDWSTAFVSVESIRVSIGLGSLNADPHVLTC